LEALPIFTISPLISPTVFSYFLIDLQTSLRYNNSIKSSNSSAHPPYFLNKQEEITMNPNVRPESMARITNFELANAFIDEQV
jgi:hypothetical protein